MRRNATAAIWASVQHSSTASFVDCRPGRSVSQRFPITPRVLGRELHCFVGLLLRRGRNSRLGGCPKRAEVLALASDRQHTLGLSQATDLRHQECNVTQYLSLLPFGYQDKRARLHCTHRPDSGDRVRRSGLATTLPHRAGNESHEPCAEMATLDCCFPCDSRARSTAGLTCRAAPVRPSS